MTRALLFEEDAPNVEALRFHDLRSTFCTWARRAGKSDAWISERTGHELSGDMINRYDRGATTLEDLAYAPFPTIARALPELAAMTDALAIVRTMLVALANPLAKTTPKDTTMDVEPEPYSIAMTVTYNESGREDLNLRLLGPEPSALPGCATPRPTEASLGANPRQGEHLMAGGAPGVNPLARRRFLAETVTSSL